MPLTKANSLRILTPSMKELCVLHANCQGDPLAFLLRSTPDFTARYNLCRVVNYTRESVPDEMLASCSLFLYQPLGDRWDGLASSRLIEKLPPRSLHLHIPNMFFKGYWPFWTNKGPLNFGDSLLDRLADQGLSLSEAMHVYLRGDLPSMVDLDAALASALAYEREKERGAVVSTAEYVAAHWRERQLYTTINHPGRELLLLVADGVLAALGLSPVPEAARRTCPPCDADFDLPIHPTVGRYFGLPFVSPERTYNIFGRQLTFAQYAACYMDCRLQGLDNFIAYLHLVAN